MIKLRVTTWMMSLARTLHSCADWLALQISRAYGLEDQGYASGLPPDNKLFFLIKQSDGMYRFHGIVADNVEEARKQAWKIPGSLLRLESYEQMKMKLIKEHYRRRKDEQEQ